ncbi:MAG TPA: LPS export ABC transporter ATP-binding protein, partial [Candidatus Acidoferrales bacterium]
VTVAALQKIIAELSAAGIGVLITDHNVREALRVTGRAYIINNGRLFRAGTPAELSADAEVRRIYLGDHFSLN